MFELRGEKIVEVFSLRFPLPSYIYQDPKFKQWTLVVYPPICFMKNLKIQRLLAAERIWAFIFLSTQGSTELIHQYARFFLRKSISTPEDLIQ